MLETAEWLETDGLGGFASGTVSGVRTRRYHGLLLAATRPPTGRMMLVNGVEAWVVTDAGRWPLSTHLYQPGVQHPDGASRLAAFSRTPWPTWTWELPGGVRVVGELFATQGSPRIVMTWKLAGAGAPRVRGQRVLEVRPLMSGRDYHSMHRENGGFAFDPHVNDAVLTWRPYPGLPEVACLTNGAYTHAPDWFRRFLYLAEQERGLDDTEDLASPGVLSFDLEDEAICVWQAGAAEGVTRDGVVRLARGLSRQERRRRAGFASPLHRAADQYLVRRGAGRTIVAGYPWFTDWGRDTFISLRGLCLAAGRLDVARDVLLEWTGVVSEGMLPNRFPDAGGDPEYNSVDASLWFVVAVRELLESSHGRRRLLSRAQRVRLQDAVTAILEGYSRGTRYGIRADSDGLLAAGERGQQLTWMDARVDGREITPRVGKPVEIQALWLNALAAGGAWDRRWQIAAAHGMESFGRRFWNDQCGYLFDVVDVDHRPGVNDPTLRPNQVLAVGGLPTPIVIGDRARSVVDAVERDLWTPLGLRSLAPHEAGYVPQYLGSASARDAAYHQGTVWPWLIGPLVDAWLRVHGSSEDARARAQARFIAPLEAHLNEAGLGHVSEIADADPPFAPRGCPFQAWSLGELIRARALAGAAGDRAPRPEARVTPGSLDAAPTSR